MTRNILEQLKHAPIVPLISAEDPAVAVETARALVSGGLSVIEVVLRTDEALECVRQVVELVPDAVVGAGTVLTVEQANAVIDAGAEFIVSPGIDAGVIEVARNARLQVFPGIATPTELQLAWNLGVDIVKFFPAGLNGGTAMLKAMSAVFRGVQFMPTGGVSASNLADYLAVPAVLACGGSWLTPNAEINTGNFEVVSQLAEEALVIANNVRST